VAVAEVGHVFHHCIIVAVPTRQEVGDGSRCRSATMFGTQDNRPAAQQLSQPARPGQRLPSGSKSECMLRSRVFDLHCRPSVACKRAHESDLQWQEQRLQLQSNTPTLSGVHGAQQLCMTAQVWQALDAFHSIHREQPVARSNYIFVNNSSHQRYICWPA
jgi:hypothetical protein